MVPWNLKNAYHDNPLICLVELKSTTDEVLDMPSNAPPPILVSNGVCAVKTSWPLNHANAYTPTYAKFSSGLSRRTLKVPRAVLASHPGLKLNWQKL